jgi:hypothetical protein
MIPFGRPRSRWKDNIKMDLREICYGDYWNYFAGPLRCQLAILISEFLGKEREKRPLNHEII